MDKGEAEGTAEAKVGIPIFSEDDMRRIVRDWLEAFIRGDVELPITKENVRKEASIDREGFARKTEEDIFKLIEIASGANLEPTQFRTNDVIKALFGYILMFRLKNIMKGTFPLSTELEVKIEKMEQIVGKLTGTVEHLDKFAPELQTLKEYKPFFDQLKRYMDRTEKDWDKGEEAGRKEWR